jgi:hypothetical protein
MAYADALPKPVIEATIAKVKAAGRRGLIVPIGTESRALQVLVEDGVIWQSVHDGSHYKFEIAK